MELFGHVLGLSGMSCFLFAYFMLQSSRWQAQSYKYFGTNLIGSLLLVASLIIDWNLSAFLLEVAWGLISIWGIIQLSRNRTS